MSYHCFLGQTLNEQNIFQNHYKLPLLYLENCNATIAIESSEGISRRINFEQGCVWGSLFCSTSMDKLGQMFNDNEKILYWYKEGVAVPPLLVDDIHSKILKRLNAG